MRSKYFLFLLALSLTGMDIELRAQDISKYSIGISAGGTGLAGIPFQFRPSNNLAIELGLYLRTAHVDVFYDRWYWGTGIDAGLNLYIFHKKKPARQNLVSNGIYLKGGLGIHDLQEYTTSIGWVREVRSEKHKRRYLQYQFGPSIRHRVETIMNTRYPPGYQEQSEKWYSGMLYTRLTWFVNL